MNKLVQPPVTGSILDCPDGKLNADGFYMEETIAGGSSMVPVSADDTNMKCTKQTAHRKQTIANGKLTRIGGCRSWKTTATTPNLMLCSQLSCVPGKEEFVCSKMIGGHVHGTPADYGFILAKRMTCWRNGPGLPMWCSVYKIGRCLKRVERSYADQDADKPYFTGWSHADERFPQMQGGALVTATNKFLNRVQNLLRHYRGDLPEKYNCTLNSAATEMVMRFMASS